MTMPLYRTFLQPDLNTGQVKSIKKALINLSASIFEKSRQKVNFSSAVGQTVQMEPVDAQMEKRLAELSSEVRSKFDLVRSTRESVPALMLSQLRSSITKENQRFAVPPPVDSTTTTGATTSTVPEPSSAKKLKQRDREMRRRDKKKPRLDTLEDAVLATLTSRAIQIEDSEPLPKEDVEHLAAVQAQVAMEARRLQDSARKGIRAAQDLTSVLHKGL